MPNVVMYTSDRCPYCSRAKRLLETKGVEFEERHIGLSDHSAREALVELTGRRTVPQILIDEKPVGGWDDLSALNQSGELDILLGRAA
jgi:GrxC family glutaredoxin